MNAIRQTAATITTQKMRRVNMSTLRRGIGLTLVFVLALLRGASGQAGLDFKHVVLTPSDLKWAAPATT